MYARGSHVMAYYSGRIACEKFQIAFLGT